MDDGDTILYTYLQDQAFFCNPKRIQTYTYYVLSMNVCVRG